MENKFQNLEEIFRNTLNNRVENPSDRVLRKLKTKLWLADFFSLNPRKLNVFYTVALAGGVVATTLMLPGSTTSSKPDKASMQSETIPDVNADVNNELLKEPVAVAEPEADEPATYSARLFAGFSASEQNGCAPLEVNFTNRSVAATKVHWDFGNGTTSDMQNPSVVYTDPGIYQAVLTITGNAGEQASIKKQIEVLEPPKSSFTIDIENSDIADKTVQFKNTSQGAATYFWDFGDSQTQRGKEPAHTYSDLGAYQVKLIAQASNGCSDTATVLNKFIEKDYTLSFPLNFRPNPYSKGENGYYDRAGSHASIFYPQNNGVKDYKLSIKAPNGMEVFSTENIKQGWNGYIGARLAPAGTYYYKATGIYPNGKTFALEGRFKVMVEEYF